MAYTSILYAKFYCFYTGHPQRQSMPNALGLYLSDGANTRNNSEVIKAKISLSIAVGFIICHSLKWINNILEIRMVTHWNK